MNGQLRELLTGYGDVGGIWFDGWWDRPDAEWQLDRTYALIHQLQPQALIGANHHRRPFPGEDFQMFEKDLPGGKTAEFNRDAEVGNLPLETCETINGAWGFNLTDGRYKSTRDGSRVYVHVLESPDQALLMPPLGARVRSAACVAGGRRAEFSEHEFGIVLKIPPAAVDPIDTVIAVGLETK